MTTMSNTTGLLPLSFVDLKAREQAADEVVRNRRSVFASLDGVDLRHSWFEDGAGVVTLG